MCRIAARTGDSAPPAAHRAAANTVEDINRRYDIGPGDRVVAVSALDFDLSVYDIFGLLAAGGAVITVAEESRRDARRWAELAGQHGVTVWNSVPALLDMLLIVAEGAAPVLPTHLRLVLLSGDWVGLDLPWRLSAVLPGARLVALGGATEASIWSNAFEVSEILRRGATSRTSNQVTDHSANVTLPASGFKWSSGQCQVPSLFRSGGTRGAEV